MWDHELIRAIPEVGPKGFRLPGPTGRAFLIAGQPSSDLEAYICPYSKTSPAAGTTTYRGPARQIWTYKSADVVGACIGIHPDGSSTLLRKDGTVTVVPKGDPAVAEALAATTE